MSSEIKIEVCKTTAKATLKHDCVGMKCQGQQSAVDLTFAVYYKTR